MQTGTCARYQYDNTQGDFVEMISTHIRSLEALVQLILAEWCTSLQRRDKKLCVTAVGVRELLHKNSGLFEC